MSYSTWCEHYVTNVVGILLSLVVSKHLPGNQPIMEWEVMYPQFASKVLCNHPPLPGLPDHALPVLNHNQTDPKTKTMVHGNRSMIQLLLYDVITSLADINHAWAYLVIHQSQTRGVSYYCAALQLINAFITAP